MPVSSEIFDVIKVMSRKEKSFFRRYYRMNSAGKDGSILRLFEKISEFSAKNDIYDENKLKTGLDEATLRHLAVIKNNLYNLVLKSLTEYRRENSHENKVKNLLEQYDILFSMSLLKQAESILKKAKKIAVNNELFMEINNILNRERTLARYLLNADGFSEVVERVHKEQNENLAKLKNLTDVNDLGNRITVLLQKYPTSKTRDEQDMKARNEVFNNPLFTDESKMLSSTSLKRFYNLNVILKEWEGDHERSLYYAKKYADEVEKDVHENRGSLHSYSISQYSILTSSVRSNNMETYESAYSKLANFQSYFPDATERDRLEASYMLGLSVFSASADNYHPERGDKMQQDADLNFRKYEKELSFQQRIVWYFVIARFCFSKKAYPDAAIWLNRLIQLPNIDVSQDYQCYARIMNIIVAYESGNPDTIEHALRRAYYFLTKRNKVYKYERIILEYVRRSFRVRTESEINEMFVFMHRELSEIEADPFESSAFDAFNILIWLEGKIKN